MLFELRKSLISTLFILYFSWSNNMSSNRCVRSSLNLNIPSFWDLQLTSKEYTILKLFHCQSWCKVSWLINSILYRPYFGIIIFYTIITGFDQSFLSFSFGFDQSDLDRLMVTADCVRCNLTGNHVAIDTLGNIFTKP